MQNLQRLRIFKPSFSRSVAMPELKKRASNSLSAVQDTYYSTKDTFERHKVVFTVGTSIASVATAWIGYSLRHLHDRRVDKRLDSIEQAMKSSYQIEKEEIKRMIGTGSYSTTACAATAGTTLIIVYVPPLMFSTTDSAVTMYGLIYSNSLLLVTFLFLCRVVDFIMSPYATLFFFNRVT